MIIMLLRYLPLVFLLLLCGRIQGFAQPTGGWPGRPRFPDGKIAVQIGGGGSRYFGEFSDNTNGAIWTAEARYAVLPFLDIGAEVHGGTIAFVRRLRRNMGQTYDLQFGKENMVLRTTDLLSMQARFRLNLFADQPLNVFVESGAGAVMFSPEDYRTGGAEYTTRTPITALSVALGVGFEYFVARNWSLQAAASGFFVLSGELDAFDSGELVALYDQLQNPTGNPDRAQTAYDKYSSITIGITWYIFSTDDIDGDRLTGSQEAEAGTSPYNTDTDGDGLDDFLEVRLHETNPLYWDTDNDGLSDIHEITKYKTDPKSDDSDGDGLTDREELLTFGTDPLTRDTDGDGLSDGDEKRLGTNPRKVDTDKDGLVDGDEVMIWRTNPLLPDSDGDGLNDNEEVYTYRTEPNSSDTDGDGLTDFEEIRLFRTDPLVTDTDGDGLSDYDEVRRYDTSPTVPNAPGSAGASGTSQPNRNR